MKKNHSLEEDLSQRENSSATSHILRYEIDRARSLQFNFVFLSGLSMVASFISGSDFAEKMSVPNGVAFASFVLLTVGAGRAGCNRHKQITLLKEERALLVESMQRDREEKNPSIWEKSNSDKEKVRELHI